MKHVLSHGHVDIAIIGGPEGLWTAEQRLAGYREALAADGLDPDGPRILRGDYREESGAEAVDRLWAEKAPPPTALVAANDLMAIGAIERLRSKGVRVPDDVSVVGFDDIPLVRLLQPALTTVRQPARALGTAAAQALFSRLDQPDAPLPHVELAAELVIRDSVAPPTPNRRINP
jgi:DNA-binding LacI/PurR family transcriptional regulator